MSRIGNLVKVMNFHSLVRVENAKKTSKKYELVLDNLNEMMYTILENKNLKLDKKVIKPNKNGEILNIYIGNDLGFCGNFNTRVKNATNKDLDSLKIIIGKKIFKDDPKVLMNITKKDFFNEFPKIQKLIDEYLVNKKIKEINVIYNHYNNVFDIKFIKEAIFPVDIKENKDIDLDATFSMETDINKVMINITSLYICYKLKILESNSWTSENVMREQVTKESIKKLEEQEEEQLKQVRKLKKYLALKKQINNYKLIKK